MYNKNEENNEVIFTLESYFNESDSRTLYGKVKDHMSSLSESDSKKYFTMIKSNKLLDLIILEKELMDRQ